MKKVSCSYSFLVIVLFAVVCFLTDYIIIDRKLNDKAYIAPLSKCVNLPDKTYDEVAGMYVYDDMDDIKLYLYTDGTFYYQFNVRYARGVIGNYIVDGDSIILNVSFSHGSDIATRMEFSTIILSMNSYVITDYDPLYFANDEEYSSIDSVSMEKKASFTDDDNASSHYKNVLSRGLLFNGNTIESFE